jgi:hypothetical protein
MPFEARSSQVDQPTRIAEDDNGPRTTFENIEIGKVLGEMDWVVTPEMIDAQCHMDLDYDVLYSLSSPWGGRVAPPQISYRPPRWLLSRTYNIRGLFCRWEQENLKPILPDVVLRVTATVVDKYVRKDREFVTYQAEAVDPAGETVFRTRRTHVLDVLERNAPRTGKGVDSGIKAEKI